MPVMPSYFQSQNADLGKELISRVDEALKKATMSSDGRVSICIDPVTGLGTEAAFPILHATYIAVRGGGWGSISIKPGQQYNQAYWSITFLTQESLRAQTSNAEAYYNK